MYGCEGGSLSALSDQNYHGCWQSGGGGFVAHRDLANCWCRADVGLAHLRDRGSGVWYTADIGMKVFSKN